MNAAAKEQETGRFSSLRSRIFFGLVLSVWLVFSLYAGVTISYRQAQLEAALQERVDRLATLLAGALVRPMYELNGVAVESTVAAVGADADVVSIRVVDSEGSVNAEAGSMHYDSASVASATRRIVFRDSSRVIELGRVTLALSRQTLEAELRTLIINSLAINVLLAAVLALVIYLTFRSFARPFRDILDSMDLLEKGETRIALTGVSRDDEIGRISRAVLRFRDAIVSRRIAEDETRALLAEKNAMLNNVLVGILVTHKRLIVSCNTRLEQILGYSPGELTGKSARVLFDSDETFERVVYAARLALARGDSYSEELTLCRRNGEPFPAALTGRALDPGDPDGTRTWMIADITSRREAEEEVARYRHHLEALVSERTAELEKARREADLANQAKGSFLAAMSHEIRTPMNAIIGMSSLAMKSGIDARQYEYVRKINVSARLLLGIINDILDFSKIDSGKLQLEETGFDLRGVMEGVATFASQLADEKGLKLSMVMCEGVPRYLVGDPLRLTQILTNLASNAVKFTTAGSVVVRCSCEGACDMRPTADCMPADQVRLHFSVIDTGIGLTDAQQAKLFQPFMQADASTTRKYGGTGLGLAIARQLVSMMGGRIWVDSVYGRGSNFQFVVPLCVAGLDWQQRLEAAALQGTVEGAVPVSLRGLHVLLAEDNRFNQEMVLEMLGDAGVTVDVVENGHEALRALRSRSYDLILMDMMMPEMDGLEATRQIREEGRWKDLPVVALTANAGLEDRQRCIAAGMNDVLTKPFEAGDLYRMLMGYVRPWPAEEIKATTAATAMGGATIDLPDGELPVLAGIDTALLLRRMKGRVASARRLLLLFRDQYADAAGKVRKLVDPDAGDDACRYAHTLKGSAGGLCAQRLQELAGVLEAALLSGDRPSIEGATTDVAAEIERVLAGLKSL